MSSNNQLILTRRVGGEGMTHYYIYEVYERQMEGGGSPVLVAEFLDFHEALQFALDFGAEYDVIAMGSWGLDGRLLQEQDGR